jgi:multicomponent Na+:H+ antiporter subunit B
MEGVIIMALLTLLAVVTVAIIGQRSLFAVVILANIYSFLMASVLIVLDAVDVAMTEASVGAGISTVILLATLHLVRTVEMRNVRPQLMPLFVVATVAGLLVWGTLAFPPFGSPEAVIHTHVAPRYLSETIRETNVPNAVTSVLASYRGYDTLGETTVIFTAGIGVMLLLRRTRRRNGANGQDAAQ